MESNTNADVDKLLTFGQMALEQGWYDQAREYFEQALDLVPSNREAMRLLARVNEILSRKEAMATEPIRGEPVEPPLRPEARPSEQKDAPTKQGAEGLLKGSLKRGCGISLGILIILALCIGGLIALGVLLAPEPEEIEETVKEILARCTAWYLSSRFFNILSCCKAGTDRNSRHWSQTWPTCWARLP